MFKFIFICFWLLNITALTVSLKCSEKYKEANSVVPQINFGSYQFQAFVYYEGYLF